MGKQPQRKGTSYSEVATFNQCRKLWWWTYDQRLEPIELSFADPREFGKCWHAALEALRTNADPLEATENYWCDRKDVDAFEQRERVDAAMRGYIKTWWERGDQADIPNRDDPWELIACENHLRSDLMNSQGQIHPHRSFKGILDLVVRVKTPCMWGDEMIEPGVYVGENKSWSDLRQVKELHAHDQVVQYAYYASRALRERVKGVLFDVVTKAKSVKWQQEETEAEFSERLEEAKAKAEAGELKGRLRIRKQETEEQFLDRCREHGREEVAKMERRQGEPIEQFRARLDKHYASAERYYRTVVPIENRLVQLSLDNTWVSVLDLDDARRKARFPMNRGHCHKFGRPCDFWKACKSGDDPRVLEESYRLRERRNDSKQQGATAPIAEASGAPREETAGPGDEHVHPGEGQDGRPADPGVGDDPFGSTVAVG